MGAEKHLKVFRCCLINFGIIDFTFSIALGVIVGVYSWNCVNEDASFLRHNATLEQIEFFYEAVKECGYMEESDIPSSETVCSHFQNKVLPYVIISIILDSLMGIGLVTIANEESLSYGKHETQLFRKAKISFVVIPLGTLLAMCSASIALSEYTKPILCWLSFSISEQKKSHTQLIMTILTLVILVLYKPLELGIFLSYGRRMILAGNPEKNATMHLALQLDLPRTPQMFPLQRRDTKNPNKSPSSVTYCSKM